MVLLDQDLCCNVAGHLYIFQQGMSDFIFIYFIIKMVLLGDLFEKWWDLAMVLIGIGLSKYFGKMSQRDRWLKLMATDLRMNQGGRTSVYKSKQQKQKEKKESKEEKMQRVKEQKLRSIKFKQIVKEGRLPDQGMFVVKGTVNQIDSTWIGDYIDLPDQPLSKQWKMGQSSFFQIHPTKIKKKSEHQLENLKLRGGFSLTTKLGDQVYVRSQEGKSSLAYKLERRETDGGRVVRGGEEMMVYGRIQKENGQRRVYPSVLI